MRISKCTGSCAVNRNRRRKKEFDEEEEEEEENLLKSSSRPATDAAPRRQSKIQIMPHWKTLGERKRLTRLLGHSAADCVIGLRPNI